MIRILVSGRTECSPGPGAPNRAAVPLMTPGVAIELQHGPVEVLHAGVAGQPDPADRPAARGRPVVDAVLGDLPAVVLPGERQHRGGLAQAREGVDGDAALDLVTVLVVAVDDVPQVLVQRRHLGCGQRPDVGVVLAAGLVVLAELRRR